MSSLGQADAQANDLEAIELPLARVLDESLKRIEPLRDDREIILYPLFGREYIGNVAEQVHNLKYLFGDDHQIFLLGATLQSKINRSLRDVCTRGCYNLNIDAVWPELYRVINFNFRPGVVIKGAGWTLMPSFRGSLLRERYADARRAGGPRATTYLTDAEEEQGLQLRRRLGISLSAPLVVLHVREAGYHPAMPDTDFRNNDIETYLPAIRWLVQQGATVVRIGDPTMRPLPSMGPGVIDAPHHPAYVPLLDPYVISQCAFMICSFSGPMDLARAFAKPQLAINCYVTDYGMLDDNWMLLPRLLMNADGVSLGLAEIYNSFVSRLTKNNDLRYRGLRAEACRADDILAATKEFAASHLLQPSTVGPTDNPLQDYCRKEEAARNASGSHLPEERFCSFYLPGTRLASVLFDRRPGYAEGEPLPIAKRRAHPTIGLGL